MGHPDWHPQTLMMTVGGIGVKPGVVDGHVAIREYLSLTISFDHEIDRRCSGSALHQAVERPDRAWVWSDRARRGASGTSASP